MDFDIELFWNDSCAVPTFGGEAQHPLSTRRITTDSNGNFDFSSGLVFTGGVAPGKLVAVTAIVDTAGMFVDDTSELSNTNPPRCIPVGGGLSSPGTSGLRSQGGVDFVAINKDYFSILTPGLPGQPDLGRVVAPRASSLGAETGFGFSAPSILDDLFSAKLSTGSESDSSLLTIGATGASDQATAGGAFVSDPIFHYPIALMLAADIELGGGG